MLWLYQQFCIKYMHMHASCCYGNLNFQKNVFPLIHGFKISNPGENLYSLFSWKPTVPLMSGKYMNALMVNLSETAVWTYIHVINVLPVCFQISYLYFKLLRTALKLNLKTHYINTQCNKTISVRQIYYQTCTPKAILKIIPVQYLRKECSLICCIHGLVTRKLLLSTISFYTIFVQQLLQFNNNFTFQNRKFCWHKPLF